MSRGHPFVVSFASEFDDDIMVNNYTGVLERSKGLSTSLKEHILELFEDAFKDELNRYKVYNPYEEVSYDTFKDFVGDAMKLFMDDEIMEILIFVDGKWLRVGGDFLKLIFDYHMGLIMQNTFWNANVNFREANLNSNNRGLNNVNTPNGSIANTRSNTSSVSFNNFVGTLNKGFINSNNNNDNTSVGTMNRGFINSSSNSSIASRRAKTRRTKTRRNRRTVKN